MKFIEAIKYIGKGRIVYLKSKPEFLLFTNVHMQQIEPKYTYPTIYVFNTETKEEKALSSLSNTLNQEGFGKFPIALWKTGYSIVTSCPVPFFLKFYLFNQTF